MSIDSTIKNMEAALAKKKALRVEKDKSKLKRLQDQCDKKKAGVEKLQSEMGNLRTEIEQLKIRMKEDGVTDEVIYDPAGETTKDSNKKTPPAKKK